MFYKDGHGFNLRSIQDKYAQNMDNQHGRQVSHLWNYFTRFVGLLVILSMVFVGPAKISRNAAGQCDGGQGDKRTDSTPE